MVITEVRIKLMEDNNERLQAFCSVTFDDAFVVRDLKIIEGTKGSFVAMPSRKLTDRCSSCGCKNHLRARFCNQCGHKWFPPNLPACSKCTSMDIDWFETAGKGVIHSYVVVTQPIVGAFVGAVPYVVAIIELDDCKEEDGTVTRKVPFDVFSFVE